MLIGYVILYVGVTENYSYNPRRRAKFRGVYRGGAGLSHPLKNSRGLSPLPEISEKLLNLRERKLCSVE